MAEKSIIRSIRFTDEQYLLINQQVGNSFSQKFDTLVYNAYWLLPEKEKELARVDKLLTEKRNALRILSSKYSELSLALGKLSLNVSAIEEQIRKL